MDLILWRHADAEPGVPDLARKLTAKGMKQAERVGKWLNQQLPDSAKILVSPADRAQQTAQGLERKFKTVEALSPTTSVAAVLAAVNWPDGNDTTVVVGHQPVLGAIAALLVSGYEAEWPIKKGTLWWLTSRARDSDADVAVRCVIGPDFV